ncbi:MAG: hypothetical protein K8R74_07600 [Bacteroidales bacterium]|nr:hypothetical protein [Bacteroidales bacterium]
MKTLKISLLVLLLGAFVGSQAIAKEEFTKKISKSYDVNKEATLAIKNKFGKIHCQNWDKNSISIEVTITLEASSQEKANKYFDRINISFSGDADRVTATTSFDDNLFGNNNNEFSIDYMVKMPKTIGIEIDHKFGDIILEEVQGPSIVELGYGSLKANKLSGNDNELEIKFSDGFIGYVKSAELELKYSELEIDEANDMSVESKFSELDIGKIDVLTLESGYDDDYIGSIRDLDVEAGFSDVEIRSLSERLIADIDYGEIKVKEMGRNFKLIDIASSFSDANIGFNTEASFRLNATIKMGDLSYPRDRARLSVVDLSYTSNKYEGVIGENQDTSSKVMIEAKNSGVHLYYR